MAVGSAEACEYFTSDKIAETAGRKVAMNLGGGVEPRPRTTCEACHYWLPFELMSHVGQCDNPSSRHYREPAFSDKPTEECFVSRSLAGLEFMWCQNHHQTIYSVELPAHRGCRIFVSSVSLPVEDEMELTLAGD